MESAGAGPRFAVRVVDEVLAEDLAHCTPAARAAIEPVVAMLREAGAPLEWLRRCEGEGRDGTQLGGCVKLYIPPACGPVGRNPRRRSGSRQAGLGADRSRRAPPGPALEDECL